MMRGRNFIGRSSDSVVSTYQEFAMEALINKDAEALQQCANNLHYPEHLAPNAVHSLKLLKILTAKSCPRHENVAQTLKLAIEGQYFDSAKYLIDKTFELNAKAFNGITQEESIGLYSTAARNPDILDYLLQKNMKISWGFDAYNAALLVAAEVNSIRAARLIIEAMSKLNLASKKTFHTPTFIKAIQVASHFLNIDMVNELIPYVKEEEDLSDILIYLASPSGWLSHSQFSSLDKIEKMKKVEGLIIIAGTLVAAGANPNRRGLTGTAIEQAGKHSSLEPLLNFLTKAYSHQMDATATSSTSTSTASAPPIQPASLVAKVDDNQYNVETHADYHKFLKSFIDDLNKKVKYKNRCVLPKAILDALSESHPHLLCEISFELPDVPVDLGGHRFELASLLEWHANKADKNGRARVPYGNNDAETFTIKDIRAAKAAQEEILALRKPFEQSFQSALAQSSPFALEKEAGEYYNLCIHEDYNSFTASYFEWLNGTNDGKNKKQKNSVRLTAAQKAAIEADPKNARLLSVLSGKLPDVPVKLADYVFDLAELLEILRKNNGSAVVPYPAGETETFELGDIDSGMELFKQIDTLAGQAQAAAPVQASSEAVVGVQALAPQAKKAPADPSILREAVSSLVPEKVEALLSSNQYDRERLTGILFTLFNGYALNDNFEAPAWWGKEERQERELVTINIAKQLLKAGASFTLPKLEAAYELAVTKHFPGISEFLISQAEINHTNLRAFCKHAIWDKKALEILIRIKSPTLKQLMDTFREAISNDNEKILDSIKLLLSHIKNPSWLNEQLLTVVKGRNFETPIPKFASYNRIQQRERFSANVVKCLIDAGADPYNAIQNNSSSAAHVRRP